ncbi:MAG: CopD family protein [Candidatus Glassbacteria bacterium]|nr:CopD family protein [Candidatus Glassbacteria bacterium]
MRPYTRNFPKLSGAAWTVTLLLNITPAAYATEEYAGKTGEDCATCHLDPSGGGELTGQGQGYLLALSSAEDEKSGQKSPTAQAFRPVRLIAGLIHLVTAILWFGTILYVHLVLKPAYAARGLPPGEVKVGLASILVMAATGAVLAAYRVPSLSFLVSTRFGILLCIKVGLFLAMAGSAAFVVFFIGPRLKGKSRGSGLPPEGKLDVAGMGRFDGKEGRPAYIAYKGRVYDVSDSKLWKDGVHFGRHPAGAELTKMLIQAPHGEEKIYARPSPGVLAGEKESGVRPLHERVFYFMAYLNLAFVFLITLIVALWRWW